MIALTIQEIDLLYEALEAVHQELIQFDADCYDWMPDDNTMARIQEARALLQFIKDSVNERDVNTWKPH